MIWPFRISGAAEVVSGGENDVRATSCTAENL